MSLTRLDKILSDSGYASRKEIKALIKSGRVSVDSVTAYSAEAKFDPMAVNIAVDGKPVNCAPLRYIMMNKPGGVLSATEDEKQQTVIDLLEPQLRRIGLFPVGRLDKDTTGLLLLTNDGSFAHRVASPKKHVSKTYKAAVSAVLEQTDADAFAEGIVLEDNSLCMPAKLDIISPYVAMVTICEGKYHQIKRMFAARGKYVTALSRETIGGLGLDRSLKPGEYRDLTTDELESIFSD